MKKSVLLAFFVVALALAAAVPGRTAADHSAGSLPERLSAEDFWQLSVQFSEPSEDFISDNLVSNEMSFAQVVPQLRASTQPGGVYIGVGPEQNFTYLVAMRARFGFIVDIRRGNLLLHLLYKAIFHLSPNRVAFLSRLFSRPPPTLSGTAEVGDLMNAFMAAPVDGDAVFRQRMDEVRTVLTGRFRIPLTAEDIAGIEQVYQTFRTFGPSLRYVTASVSRPFGEASYANLMSQQGAQGEPLSYLGTEESYQFVKDLQARNVIVPVVGNFAGPKSIRGIGSFLRNRNATVETFYLSNVEDYLGRERVPQNGDWNVFCANAATLPRNSRSSFIRPLGLAVYGSDGSLTVARQMHVGSRPKDAVTLAPGAQLTSSLTLISEDVKGCSGAR